ncbi:AsmA family protein [Sphingobium sufflavum]|uniref:AsmA family protein n=1 Tax=Sphingobium sufflavum TaxID=1129547 RepID=UPI001F4659D1|nr:AsmA family protein [Sphingobium sufflavum]MCE7796640.1 AsmA family protein [Sphingobium sufflavum]
MTFSLSRRTTILLSAGAVLLLALVLLLATFPVGWLKGRAERQLGERFGTAVRIGALERESGFSFSPVIRVADVHVPQQPWAGRGELAAIGLLRVRVPVLPLLVGRGDVDALTASDIRLNLVRAADGRANWRGGKDGDNDSDAGGGAGFAGVRIENAVIRYRDAVQRRAFTLSVTADPVAGLSARGRGTVDGAPVTLRVRGGAMAPGRPWPFEADIAGAALTMAAKGSMAAPLDTRALTFRVTARADDLKRIDRIIEAGLFGTQPVALAADVRRADGAWIVQSLTGTIGRSRLNGHISARKVDGRVKLDGDVRFAALDFEDLASDEGNARARALEQAEGLRLVPNTRINIGKIDRTDGRIGVRVDRILGGRRPSSLRDLSGVLHLDRRILTVEPLRIGLTRGAITGKVVVNQRDGQPAPRVTIALDMTGSSIAALVGGGEAGIDARMDARVRLTGVGSTVREAVGRSDGSIGIVARNGVLPAKIAALIGFDVGRGLLGRDEERATLRCAIVRLDMRGGTGTFAPLLIDTSASQTRGTGAVSFPNEAIAATLTGAPKKDALLVVPGYITARGTIREPEVVVPPQTKSVGNVLKAIGRAITGHDEVLATDADCATLGRKTIGR